MDTQIMVARFYVDNGEPKVEMAHFVQTTEEHASRLNAIQLPFDDMEGLWWTLLTLENAAVDLTTSGTSEERNLWGEIQVEATPGQSRPASYLYDYAPREGVTIVDFETWREKAEEQREQKSTLFPDEGFPEVPASPPKYVWESGAVMYGNSEVAPEFV